MCDPQECNNIVMTFGSDICYLGENGFACTVNWFDAVCRLFVRECDCGSEWEKKNVDYK